MTSESLTPLSSLAQKVASSRPGAWFLSGTLHHLDLILRKLTGSRSTLTNLVTGLSVVFLTTTGARSGLPRTLPLLCIRDERDPLSIVLIASNWGQSHHPAWYFNLKAHPKATCAIDGQVGEYIAREATGEDYERYWQTAVSLYFGFQLYRQRAGRRRIPIMVLTPI